LSARTFQQGLVGFWVAARQLKWTGFSVSPAAPLAQGWSVFGGEKIIWASRAIELLTAKAL